MALILCEIEDTAALWAAARLQERGMAVDLLFAPSLGAARRWEHRVGISGASVEITLADGRVLSSRDPTPILNRIGFIPTERLRRTAGADLGYAMQEMYAFYLSWLYAWPAVVLNRPTPQGLCGNHRHPSAWAVLGTRAGLPARSWLQDSDEPPERGWFAAPGEATIFVAGDTIVIPPGLPAELEAGCRSLAELARSPLLGIDFAQDANGWAMVGASPMPYLMRGGDDLITALMRVLGR